MEQLTFNDSLNLLGSLGTGLTTLGGAADVTYGADGTNTVSGSLTLTAAGLLAAQTYTNLAVTQTAVAPDGVTPIYTLTGSNLLTSVSITYTGPAPTSMTANVTLLSTGLSVASGTGNVAAVCFAAGTFIRTVKGDVAVEHLAVGDLVVTASGEHRPVRWLGHRVIDCSRHPHPQDVLPVRIAAHAFGTDRPARDLFVSPGHSVCVDVLGEVLIVAAALVNGSTIQQVERNEITYWHVELDSHDIVLAENLPAESYLNMGNRCFFTEGDVVMLSATPDEDPALRTYANYCRPFHVHGAIVDAVREQLRIRAVAQGWALSTALELHLEVDGRRVDPVVNGLTARFQLPHDAKDVWLVAPASRPCDLRTTPDARSLGLPLFGLRVDDGLKVSRDVAIDDPMLADGFHAAEVGGDRTWRWTADRARLPAAMWEDCVDSFFLRLDLVENPLPRWTRAPQEHAVVALIAEAA